MSARGAAIANQRPSLLNLINEPNSPRAIVADPTTGKIRCLLNHALSDELFS